MSAKKQACNFLFALGVRTLLQTEHAVAFPWRRRFKAAATRWREGTCPRPARRESYLLVLEHDPPRREGRGRWPPEVAHVLQGVSAPLLLLLVVAVALLLLLSRNPLQNGMHGRWVHFQHNPESKGNAENQDLRVGCET